MSYEHSDWSGQISALRGEIEGLRGRILSLEGNIGSLRESVQDIRTEVQSKEASLLKQLESVRGEVKSTRMEVLGQLEKTYDEVSKNLSQTNQRVQAVAHSVNEVKDSLKDAMRENQRRLDALGSQLKSELSTLQGELKKEIKASHESIVEKTAEINESMLKFSSQSTRTLRKLLEDDEEIKTSVKQVAENTLAVVREELSQQEVRAKELQQSFNKVSEEIYVKLSNFMDDLKQELENTKSEVNKKIDELGSKTLATAYDVATTMAFLEALRNDINKALDTVIASVDLCCEKNLINQILPKAIG